MKTLKSFIVAVLLIPAIVTAQGQMTSEEYLAQHPELYSAPGSGAPAVQDHGQGDSHQLLNGLTYTYVGYFDGLTGPLWSTNPPCYTGQEAAALLFGGAPDDYAISTNPNTADPNTITFTAWMVTWGVSGWAEYSQNYKLDAGNVGYNDPGGVGTATSAYVWDNPPPPGSSINYVWRVEGANPNVPVSNWALFIGIGLILTAAVIRFRKLV